MPFRLGPAERIRAAFHVLYSGDYQPASAYLDGVRDGLDRGFTVAWDEILRRFPSIGPTPEAPGDSACHPSLNRDAALASPESALPDLGGSMGKHDKPAPQDNPTPAPGPSGDGVPSTVTQPGSGTHKKPTGK